MKKINQLFIAIIILVISNQLRAGINQPEFLTDTSTWADSILNTMTIEEKIGQLFMVAAYSNKNSDHKDEITHLIKNYHIGGLIFFQGGPLRQAQLTNYYQSVSKVPLLLAMDAEWGLGMRLDSTISYPRQMMLGAIQDDHLIYEMGSDIAKQLKRLGVHVNFAPVVDVNNNPQNPVINSRSFGENPELVGNKSLAYMVGMQDHHLITTAKHFPGHGDTDTDSHHALPIIKHSRKRLDTLELVPFQRLINNGVSGIMVAHLNLSAFHMKEGEATTLSPEIVTDMLRDSMKFEGLVFTDALNMKGISNFHKPGDAELLAYLAGNDVLLFPQDVPKAVSRIKKEIRKGNVSLVDLNNRVKRILKAKYWTGAYLRDSVQLEGLVNDLNKPEYKVQRNHLIQEAITIVQNRDNFLPVKQLNGQKFATLAINENSLNAFQQTIKKYVKTTDYFINQDSPNDSCDAICKDLAQYDLVFVGVHNTNRSPWKKYGINTEHLRLIEELGTKTKVVLTIFGNPYALSFIERPDLIDGIVMAYNDWYSAQLIVPQILFGAIDAKGKLPISAGSNFSAQTGINTDNIKRLSYSEFPEEAGFNSIELNKIDSIAEYAIEIGATPGCQVLIARNGKVAYQKNFGYHTYFKKQSVSDDDIYDIASITKIASTVPALMSLHEQGKIEIEGKLGDYLPGIDTSNKADLLIKEVLTHQAGLAPWIPFYLSTIETLYPDINRFDNNISNDYPFQIGKGFYLHKHFRVADDVFKPMADEQYSIEVAQNRFLKNAYRDSVYFNILNSDLLDEKQYRYSDLGYYLFYQMIENLTGEKLQDYVHVNFYDKLGMYTTGYLPLTYYDENNIIPTENDQIFRKQILKGYVHDPGAAMLGGVCGHAGLFSSANDLAKIMQMFLQNGYYGGEHYFKPETIQYFTSCPYCDDKNRRGIGFDKPETDPDKQGPTCKSASTSSFGHTGFTGTMVWADPDNGLLYVFLSNRIYPDQNNTLLIRENIRTDIQQIAYDALSY